PPAVRLELDAEPDARQQPDARVAQHRLLALVPLQSRDVLATVDVLDVEVADELRAPQAPAPVHAQVERVEHGQALAAVPLREVLPAGIGSAGDERRRRQSARDAELARELPLRIRAPAEHDVGDGARVEAARPRDAIGAVE